MDELEKGLYEINFLRKNIGMKELTFSFPTVPDVSNILKKDICRILDVREFKRGRYIFNELANFPNLY